MLKNRCEWQRAPEKERGILVACDCHQEWLLAWWWERYSAENNYPVTFIDLGMTKDANKWCQERGEVIAVHIDSSFIKSKEEMDPEKVQHWERFYGSMLWISRPNWFKKPFACLHSRYQKTIWIDLDCEILQPVDDLFLECTSVSEIGLVREFESEHLPRMHPEVFYNGGVIVYSHGSEIICKWAQESIVRNGSLLGDDKVLSALIYELQWPVVELPAIYNWKFIWGFNENAVIYHWFTTGKTYIKNHGGIKPALEAYKSSFENNE